MPDASYIPNGQVDSSKFYCDVIDVSVSQNLRACKVKLFVTRHHAPYVETKPFHQSQEVIERTEEGIVIQFRMQHNFELKKEIPGFGKGIRVLEPKRLKRVIQGRLQAGLDAYTVTDTPVLNAQSRHAEDNVSPTPVRT